MAWYSHNVVWNWGAANDAMSALRRAADLLDRTADERQYKAREATAEWRGAHRDRFDDELRRILQRARDLAAEYRNTANRIAQASQHARDEQNRREEERRRAEENA